MWIEKSDVILQTLHYKDMFLLLENNFRGDISSVMGDRYVVSDDNKTMKFIDADNICGHSMVLPYVKLSLIERLN